MLVLRLDQVTKRYPNTDLPAVEGVCLDLEAGQILGLLGPSGCGKTTLLRLLAGFERPEEGAIEIGGRIVAGSGSWIPPEKRRLGMVFQEFALFPHLTVAQNVAFGLSKSPKRLNASARERTAQVLELVELRGLENRYPHELSGGQRQRVALARALAPQPELVLLDEPLSNLDVQVRLYLREEIRKILKATGTTAIFVTHDREEALAISDTVGVMRQGRLEQLGTPEAIYQEPVSRFVAQFVTQANFLPARRNGGVWETEVGCFDAALQPETVEVGELMIREEDIILSPDRAGEVTIRDRQFLGREHRYCLVSPSGRELHARSTQSGNLPVGARVQLSVPGEAVRVFPQD